MATGISGTGTSSSARLCCRSRPQEAREQRAREREMPFLANQSPSSKRRGARRGWTRHVRYSCTPVVFGVDTYLGARPRRGCAVRARTRDRLGVITRRRAPPARDGRGCRRIRAVRRSQSHGTRARVAWRHALSPVCINRRRRSAHRTPRGRRCAGGRGCARCYAPKVYGPSGAARAAGGVAPGRTPRRVRSDMEGPAARSLSASRPSF